MSSILGTIIRMGKTVLMGLASETVKNYSNEELMRQYKMQREKEQPNREVINMLKKEMQRRRLL